MPNFIDWHEIDKRIKAREERPDGFRLKAEVVFDSDVVVVDTETGFIVAKFYSHGGVSGIPFYQSLRMAEAFIEIAEAMGRDWFCIRRVVGFDKAAIEDKQCILKGYWKDGTFHITSAEYT